MTSATDLLRQLPDNPTRSESTGMYARHTFFRAGLVWSEAIKAMMCERRAPLSADVAAPFERSVCWAVRVGDDVVEVWKGL